MMCGGSAVYDDCEFTSPSNGAKTLILVGRTGNGKSASILGIKSFTSKISPSGVTRTCELQRTVLKYGQIFNVIDTPGMVERVFIGKEIAKCIDLAKDGIHAVAVFFSLKTLFTNGDALEEDVTLKDYLDDSPQPLKNGGQPYYDELFVELKRGATTCDKQEEVASLKGYIKQEICKEQNERLYEKLLMRISELVEAKLKRLEEKLAEKQAARKSDQMKLTSFESI
ncbi:hypothetical protein CXB51_005562 [Gossypium anomalum]|uniref:AIG1-type G domain-containing protein n=1 Tax=Gossypium anomalum TaxID=47600 RepID=A0A8J5ZWP2_9ROSI|nr:hypothetical protein CXB51_005562 [Gossypium anomalum]